ncbi:MAG TPA: hypothetical protein VFF27_18285 [Bacteroidia bacterium]|nr:hypothetical protein [Bacteroidia bacterium]
MEDESVFNDREAAYKIVSYLDLETWHNHFRILYKAWLTGESDEIYTLQSNINYRIISKIGQLNKKLKGIKIFYWFDMDRSKEEYQNFSWTTCPLSGKPLIELEQVHLNNKFISPVYPIVFPG